MLCKPGPIHSAEMSVRKLPVCAYNITEITQSHTRGPGPIHSAEMSVRKLPVCAYNITEITQSHTRGISYGIWHMPYL